MRITIAASGAPQGFLIVYNSYYEALLYSIEPACTILNFLCVENHWVGGGLEYQGRSCVKESRLREIASVLNSLHYPIVYYICGYVDNDQM